MNHIFVSYSRKNEKTVDSFTDRMRNAGIQVWQDKSGAGTGIPFSTKWFSMIVEAIYLADGAVVFRSPQWEQSRICGKEYDLIRRCALPSLELDPAEVDADPEAALGEVRRFMASKVRNMPNSRRGTLFSCAYELKSGVSPYQLIENPRGLSDTLEYLFVDLGGMKKQMEEQNYAEKDPEISTALDMIRRNVFSLLSPGLFDPILRALLDYNDYYMLLADLRSYSDAQDRVDAAYRDQARWNRMSLVNIARSGRFSSDRAVAEYARDIWHVEPVVF